MWWIAEWQIENKGDLGLIAVLQEEDAILILFSKRSRQFTKTILGVSLPVDASVYLFMLHSSNGSSGGTSH